MASKMTTMMGEGKAPHTETENGASAYTFEGVGDKLVALWFKLTRGCPRADLREMIGEIVREAAALGATREVGGDLLVMAFQTRDVREGKGERQLFFWMLLELHASFPEATLELLGMIGHFGCYKDVKALLELAEEEQAEASEEGAAAAPSTSALSAAALDVLAAQLRADVVTATERAAKRTKAAAVAAQVESAVQEQQQQQQGEEEQEEQEEEEEDDGPSLCAKWAPREGQPRFAAQAKRLALRMFPPSAAERAGPPAVLHRAVQRARKRYRQLVASLNREIATVEVRMSAGEWAAIAPHALPAACLRKKQAALLNRPSTRGALLRASRSGPGGFQVREAGADADRVACATRMVAHLVAGGAVHGRPINVHSLVGDCMGAAAPDLVAEAQWADVRAMFEEMAADPLRPCKLGKYVALADVSGSMHGDPMAVAIGLGILISEVSHPAFRDRFMTFESTPRWHSLAGEGSLHAKVRSAARAPWGGSTDFGAAMDLLLETCVAAQLGPADVPEGLIVVSDMQFDEARGHYAYGGGAPAGWDDEVARIGAAWRSAGYAKAPTIVFWNVSARTESFPATADTPGVAMVSGFSQNLLKLFMEGGDECFAPTPLVTMRRALDDAAFDGVRALVRRVLSADAAVAVAAAAETTFYRGDERWAVRACEAAAKATRPAPTAQQLEKREEHAAARQARRAAAVAAVERTWAQAAERQLCAGRRAAAREEWRLAELSYCGGGADDGLGGAPLRGGGGGSCKMNANKQTKRSAHGPAFRAGQRCAARKASVDKERRHALKTRAKEARRCNRC